MRNEKENHLWKILVGGNRILGATRIDLPVLCAKGHRATIIHLHFIVIEITGLLTQQATDISVYILASNWFIIPTKDRITVAR